MQKENPFHVGIGVMVMNDKGQVLLGKRIGGIGDGDYAFPGGHLEYQESYIDCAIREVREECGIELKNVRFSFLGNMIEHPPRHYVQVGIIGDYASGELTNMEPDKCEGWDWYNLDDLPGPIYTASEWGIKAHKENLNFLDKQI